VQRIKLEPYLKLYSTINSKWIDFTVSSKTIKILKDNITVDPNYPSFLDVETREQATEQKVDKLDYTTLKSFTLQIVSESEKTIHRMGEDICQSDTQ
jgi:hypothetical protein